MGFFEAVKVCFQKYTTASGRAKRSEYWYFWLFSFLVQWLCSYIGVEMFYNEYFGTFASLVFLLPGITVGIRRMHDTGHSGWYLLIPIYNFILCLMPSEEGANQYGEPCEQSDSSSQMSVYTSSQSEQPRQRRFSQAQPAVKPEPIRPQQEAPIRPTRTHIQPLAQEPQPEPQPEPISRKTVRMPQRETPGPKDKNYFKSIIANWFPNLTIAEDVPVTQVTGDIFDIFKLYETRPTQAYKAEWGKPYSLVLYSEGAPRCIIMLVNQEDRPAKKVKYLISKMFAQKMNIPYLYFYTDMENEELYCIKRIREAMK